MDRVKADFRQSTFFSHPIHSDRLSMRAASHWTKLSREGEVALFILDSLRERSTLEHVAREAHRRFPDRFADWRAALGLVGAFSAEYGESPAEDVEHLYSRTKNR